MFSSASIPTLVGGTVPVADRKVFDQRGGGVVRVQQVAILITAVGAHASFVATLEGSFDGQRWFSLALSPLNPKLPAGIVLDDKGIGFTSALGTSGFLLTFEVAVPMLRIGLGGNAAPGGSGIVEYRSVRV